MVQRQTGRKRSNSGYKYVTGSPDRHGKIRWRFYRRGHPSCYLPSPDSPDFEEAYAKALTARTGRRTRPQDSFDAAIDRFMASRSFKALRAPTQANYRRRLSHLGKQYGEYSIKTLRRDNLVKILEQSQSAAERNRTLSVFRRVLQESVEQGVISENVAASIPRAKQVTNGYVTWTRKDIADFEKYHVQNATAILAIRLLYYTGQRSSDVARMGSHSLKAGRIQITQGKTGTPVNIPVHPRLQKVIPEGEGVWLLNAYGKPFSVKGFQQWFVKQAKRAGIEGKSAHGLRKALATHLAESGATAHQIMAVLGHLTLSESQKYVAAVNKSELADEAFRKLG